MIKTTILAAALVSSAAIAEPEPYVPDTAPCLVTTSYGMSGLVIESERVDQNCMGRQRTGALEKFCEDYPDQCDKETVYGIVLEFPKPDSAWFAEN